MLVIRNNCEPFSFLFGLCLTCPHVIIESELGLRIENLFMCLYLETETRIYFFLLQDLCFMADTLSLQIGML